MDSRVKCSHLSPRRGITKITKNNYVVSKTDSASGIIFVFCFLVFTFEVAGNNHFLCRLHESSIALKWSTRPTWSSFLRIIDEGTVGELPEDFFENNQSIYIYLYILLLKGRGVCRLFLVPKMPLMKNYNSICELTPFKTHIFRKIDLLIRSTSHTETSRSLAKERTNRRQN